MTLAERLQNGFNLLSEIDQRIEKQDNPGLFWAVDQRLIARELADLERQFLPVPVIVVRSKNRWVRGN